MSLQAGLEQWLSGIPEWQSDLVRRLCTTGQLDEAALQEGCSLLRTQYGALAAGEASVAPVRAQPQQLPQQATMSGSLRLVALHSVENVNALAHGQRLPFGINGMTVVYGDNGAGKSSYARVLKEACRASARTPVLHNIFAGTDVGAALQRAVVEVEEAGARRDVPRAVGTAPSPELTTISVFDAACADVYCTKPTEVTYVPQALTLFVRLARTQERIAERLNAERQALAAARPKLEHIPRTTEAGRFVEAMSAKTTPEELQALATLSEEEAARLQELKAQLAVPVANIAEPVGLMRKRAAAARRLAGDLHAGAERLGELAIEKFKSAVTALASAQSAASILSQKAAGTAALPGAGGPLWRALWTAAEAFCASHASEGTVGGLVEATVCPLCMQSVGAEARTRFRTFQALASGAAEKELNQCRQALETQVAWLHKLSFADTSVGGALELLLQGEPTLQASVRAFTEAALARRDALHKARTTHQWDAVPPLPDSPAPRLVEWAAGCEARAKEMETLAQPEQRAAAQRMAAELEARQLLGSSLNVALGALESLRRSSCLDRAVTALNTRGVTQKLNAFMEAEVTDELRVRLAKELAALGLQDAPVRVGSQGRAGRTLLNLELAAKTEHGVGKVLSEGELRALSLAFFLAEVGAASHDGGIVLDDPVSSLDHARRRHVAQRLAEESLRRQVIVFTHDLVFLNDLRQAAEAQSAGCKAVTVQRQPPRTAGIVREEEPWKMKNCAQRAAALRNDLVHIRKLHKEQGPTDAYAGLAKPWFGRLRDAWERAIEERLFKGTIQRFVPDVRTRQLEKLQPIEKRHTDAIKSGMTVCSNWVHDQPTASNTPPPPPTELEAELKRYQDFLDEVAPPA